MSSIEEQLSRISAALARISERLEPRLPRLLTTVRFAKELGVGHTKLRQLISEGRVQTVRLGKRYLVPTYQLEMLAMPRPSAKKQASPRPRTPAPVDGTGADAAARARVRLKKL